MILVAQAAEPRLPGAPRWGGRWPYDSGAGVPPRPTPRRQPARGTNAPLTPSRPDEMRPTRLALGHPGLVDPRAITDAQAGPLLDEGGKGGFGAVRVDHRASHRLIGHHPPPVQRVGQKPRGCINRIDWGLAGLARYGLRVRLHGVRHPIEPLLDGAQTQGHLEDRGTQGLDCAAPRAMGPGECPHEGRQAWPLPGRMLGRDGGLGPLGTHGTPRFLSHKRAHVHLDGRQRNDLMRVRGPRPRQGWLATRALVRCAYPGLGWGQERLPMPRMAGLPPDFTPWSVSGRLAYLCRRRVGRGRTLRGGGVLLEPCFDSLQTLQQCHAQRLDTGRRRRPIGGRHLSPCRYCWGESGCGLHRGSSCGVRRFVAHNVWNVSQKEQDLPCLSTGKSPCDRLPKKKQDWSLYESGLL